MLKPLSYEDPVVIYGGVGVGVWVGNPGYVGVGFGVGNGSGVIVREVIVNDVKWDD